MTAVAIAGAVILGLLLAELRVSQIHERWLIEQGAVRPPGDPYVALAILYPLAFLAMIAEGIWRARHSGGVADGPNWFVSGVLLFVAGKAIKYWAVHTLGPRWTFKVFVLPGRPLATEGPYRYLEHPNYVGLVGELVGAAMMCGAPVTGVVGFLAFGQALWRRIRFESGILDRVRTDGK
ncbi:MAG TPA: isoprenylcysteine carboxylmethyltransferase family protein [Vicinamibacterales bacterium]|nr:isoprenylcysteine carboxylmethyltransferase family protein [Vicinamibacterales bacterium]